MAKDQSEEVLGQHLATWVDALREGKGIEISDDDLHELDEQQAYELMAMARFIKVVEFPTEHWEGRSDDIRARLGKRLFEERLKQLAEGYARVVSAGDLGECLGSARQELDLSIQDLVIATGIPKSLLEDVEAGNRSPIRIQVEKMTELLQRLHLAFDVTVDLVKSTSENWTAETFQQGQTQLGRMGREQHSDEHNETVMVNSGQDLDSEVQRELDRIDEYADALRKRIQFVAPKY